VDHISGGNHLYFSITKWTAVENTDAATKGDYPNGYKLDGSVTAINGSWGVWTTVGQKDQPIYVYMHKDRDKIRRGDVTFVFVIIYNKQ
jgi:hypothetical protein